MTGVFSMTVPVILAGVAFYAMSKRVDVYAAMTAGASEGLRVLLRITPVLIPMFAAIYMLRASGALDAACGLIRPVLERIGIPPECAPLMLIRPLSGSGALASAGEIIGRYGPDSLIGRTAAVMLGSTETTFYTIAVYFGSANIKKTRHAVPAALMADLTGFIVASLTARILF